MPSTRKQKAKKMQSRQLDIMSDVENFDVMLGSYTRNEDRDEHSENELNLDSESSRPQRNSNLTGEDYRPHTGPKAANSTMEDQMSSGLQRNPEVENTLKTWETRPKRCFMEENNRKMSRQSSVGSYNSEQNRDISISDIDTK